jgi:tRNA(Ile)-lysidine synthetase-like protein
MEVLREESGRVRKLESKVLEYDETRAVVRLPPTGKPALKTQGSLKFSGLTLYWRLRHTTRPFSPVRRNGREFFDADRVGAHLLLRHWRPGDRFQPIGLTSPRKLQDWFVNRKVPAAQRRRLVLAENEQGDLFWVQGERIGEACKITPATRRILELRWKQP